MYFSIILPATRGNRFINAIAHFRPNQAVADRAGEEQQSGGSLSNMEQSQGPLLYIDIHISRPEVSYCIYKTVTMCGWQYDRKIHTPI